MIERIEIEIPPVWVKVGKKGKRRAVQRPGLPALHNLGTGRLGTRPYTEQQARLLKAELLKWRRPPKDSEQRYSILLVRVSRHPLDWDVGNGKAGEQLRAIGGDNAGSALKHIRDQLNSWLLWTDDDRDDRIEWAVGQRWGPPKYVGVEIYLSRQTPQWWALADRFLRGEL